VKGTEMKIQVIDATDELLKVMVINLKFVLC